MSKLEPRVREASLSDAKSKLAFEDLAEGLRMPVCILHADASAAFANSAFCEDTSPPPREACGLGWLSAVHRDDFACTPSHWRRAFEHGARFNSELRLRRGTGGHDSFRACAVPLRDGSGCWLLVAEPIGSIAGVPVSGDASAAVARDQLEAENRLRLALAANRTGIWEWSLAPRKRDPAVGRGGVSTWRGRGLLSNLLTNAARYTKAGGRIAVMGACEGNRVVLRVRDNGAGIPEDLMPHLFDMFVQGTRGLDHTEGGLGLGLALVRNLTALHGGTVEAYSDGPGRGSEFTVRLPVASESSPR